jgi:hypothetical protein
MKKDIKAIKAAAKAYFDFYKKNFIKTQTLKFDLYSGLTVTAKYNMSPYGDIDFDEIDFKATKEIKALFDVLSLDIGDRLWDLDFTDRVDTACVDTLYDLGLALNAEVFDDNDEVDWPDYLDSGSRLTDFYETVEEFIPEDAAKKPKSISVSVSRDYSGTVTKGLDYVQVGCQRITIENVKGILKAYEEVNG